MNHIQIKSPLVSINWLYQNLQASNLVILDATIAKVSVSTIKTEVELIPKSIFFDIKTKFSDTSAEFPNTLPSKQQFETEVQKLGIDNHSAIVVYDRYGIYSGARAWWLFKYFGHNNIAVLDGGLPEWKTHKLTTVNAYKEVFEKGNFKAEINVDLITNLKGIQQFLKDETVQIIDARSSKRFNSEIPEPREGLRRGTIPNSKNLPFTELLNGNVFKTPEKLTTLFKNVVGNKQKLIFSCGSGITACNLALGATLLGYKNLIVYDGSWTEYGTKIRQQY